MSAELDLPTWQVQRIVAALWAYSVIDLPTFSSELELEDEEVLELINKTAQTIGCLMTIRFKNTWVLH